MTSSTFAASSAYGYETQMGRWSRRLAEPFLDLCRCADDEAILDAGCGTGSLTFALANRAKNMRIEGIDFHAAVVTSPRATV